jgi:hypothetical protein
MALENSLSMPQQAFRQLQRAHFFCSMDSVQLLLFHQQALKLGQVKVAGEVCDELVERFDHFDQRDTALLQQALAEIISESYVSAGSRLIYLDDRFVQQEQVAVYAVQGGIAFGQERYSDWMEYNRKTAVLLNLDTSFLAETSKSIQKIQRKHRPGKAKIMSLFLPGLGQYWNGYFKEGTNSLLLVGGFTILLVRTIIHISWLDGIVGIYPWFSRYHFGGARKAGRLADFKRQQKLNALYNHTLEQLNILNIPSTM